MDIFDIKNQIVETMEQLRLYESQMETKGQVQGKKELENARMRFMETKMWIDAHLRVTGK